MACLSENACLGRNYAGKRDALSNMGEQEKRLTLRAVAGSYIFNLGTGVPDSAQQSVLKLPHPIKSEDKGRLFFTRFDGSMQWDGFDTVLKLDAKLISASLYINGNYVTKVENTLMTALVRVDEFLKKKNSLYLKLDNNDTEEDEVIRSLSLFHVPKSRITDLFIKSRIDHGKAEVSASITVKAGDIGMAVGGSVIMSLHDGRTTVAETEIRIPAFRKNHWVSVRAKLIIESPRLWSLEDPYRYTALIQLFRADGTIADVRRVHYGVRELWLRRYERRGKIEPQMVLNGHSVKVKGAVVREQYAALPGRLKKMGFNAVRVIEPQNTQFFEACETEGLLVMCETKFKVRSNPKQRGRKKKSVHDPLERPFALLGEMVTRLQNNSSIFCWSLGSRKAFGNEILGEFIRSIDDTRAVNCEGDFRFAVSDFFSASDCGIKELTAVSAHKPVFVNSFFKLLLFHKYKNHPLLLCETSLDTENLREKFHAVESIERFMGFFVDIEELQNTEGLKEVLLSDSYRFSGHTGDTA